MPNSTPMPTILSFLIAFLIRSDVHFVPLGSGAHMCDDISVFFHTSTSNFCCNGNTNHIYHTHNSPTSRGKYRWMTLTSPLTVYPLWYRVTYTTNRSSINSLRYSPLMVLLCRTLNISGPLGG